MTKNLVSIALEEEQGMLDLTLVDAQVVSCQCVHVDVFLYLRQNEYAK